MHVSTWSCGFVAFCDTFPSNAYFSFFFFSAVLCSIYDYSSGHSIFHIIFGYYDAAWKNSRFILVIHATRMIHFHFSGVYLGVLTIDTSSYSSHALHLSSSTLLYTPPPHLLIVDNLLITYIWFLFFCFIFLNKWMVPRYSRDTLLYLGFSNIWLNSGLIHFMYCYLCSRLSSACLRTDMREIIIC